MDAEEQVNGKRGEDGDAPSDQGEGEGTSASDEDALEAGADEPGIPDEDDALSASAEEGSAESDEDEIASDDDDADEADSDSEADADALSASGSDPDEAEDSSEADVDGDEPAEPESDESDALAASADDSDDDEEALDASTEEDEAAEAEDETAEESREAQGTASETEPDPRTLPEPPRRRGHVAPALVSLERVDFDDDTFRVRPEGDLSRLATDLARLGQLFPVDLRLKAPDRFQIICGFRRIAALKFLKREKVLARLHTDLSDEDALLMALAAAIHEKHVSTEELAVTRETLEEQGRLFPEARDMLEKALSPDDTLAPEGVEEEVDADELADDVTSRLGDINQDLALLADVFASLDDDKKQSLLEQLRYSADLVAFLEGK